MSLALPLRRPVGSPSSSLSIAPSGGSGVSLVMPASSRALLLATPIPNTRLIQTGLSGETGSRSCLLGNLLSSRRVSSQPVACIHSPSRAPSTSLDMALAISSQLFALGYLMSVMNSAAAPCWRKWSWVEIRPGVAVLPSRSMTSVSPPISSEISALVPAFRIFPSLMARAPATVFSGSMVSMVPFIRTRSA